MHWALVIVPLCWCTLDTTPPYEDNTRSIESSADHEGYKIASKILRDSINFSVDPCEDFYEFTCGNWIASHPIPKDEVSYNYYRILKDKMQKELRTMYESNDTYGSKAINAMKAFYRKCMDEDELNRIGAKRMIENVKSFGVWPALEGDDNWKEENYNLTLLLIHVFGHRTTFPFIDFYPTKDDANVRRLLQELQVSRSHETCVGTVGYDYTTTCDVNYSTLQFGQGRLLLGKSYYLDREENRTSIGLLKKRLISEIEQFQKDGGLPTNRSKTEKDVDEIIDLEMRIAEIMDADVTDNNTHQYHLREMQKILPQVDWSQFFRAVAPSFQHYFDSDPEILVPDVEYIERIKNLLQSTDPRIITNYIFMWFSREWSGEMGEIYEDIEQEYDKAMYGQQQKAPRWKTCVRDTMTWMEDANIALYVKEALHKTAKEEITKIADDLLEEFRKKLKTADWIDNETRNEALNKVDHMLRQIAYPKFVLDIGMLDKHYRDLDVHDTDSYSEMWEKLFRWDTEQFFEKLTNVPNRFVTFNPANINAFFNQDTNSLQIAAGILHPPFFHNTFPRALNYGGIGAVVGHEMTHGFDNEGRLHDAFGERDEWWNEEAKKIYEQRAQCLIDQYGKIEVPETGLNIDGKSTLSENIADHGGVRLAYEHGGQEERIEGLEQFDNEQMFFLGWATIWCGHRTNDSLIDFIRNDEHSPDRYRVNQVLANQPEFAAAFNCDVGAAMNPTKRCVLLW